jgi:hypothetical protein
MGADWSFSPPFQALPLLSSRLVQSAEAMEFLFDVCGDPSADREDRFEFKRLIAREEGSERKRGRAEKEERTRPLVPPRT